MGMGRYQWCIFFLCGFGYFLDLCWAQAGGLVAPAIHQEFGVGGESAPPRAAPHDDAEAA